MSPRDSITLVLLSSALCLGGCGILKKKSGTQSSATVAASAAPLAPPPPVAAPPPAETVPVAVAEPPVDETAVPAPQDFEEEAFEKVTPGNFKAELARLTKEVSAK